MRAIAWLVLWFMWFGVLAGLVDVNPVGAALLAIVCATFCSFGDMILVAVISRIED